MALTKVAATTNAAACVPADQGRSGVVIENSDPNTAFVLLGPGTVSTSNYSFTLAQNTTAALNGCKIAVSVIWGTAGAGQLLVSEF